MPAVAMMNFGYLLATFIMLSTTVNSARILAVLPLGGKSHHRFMHPVMMSLARAGHEVVLYSPFPDLFDNQPANLTHVFLENIRVVDTNKDMNQFINTVTEFPFWKCLDLQWILLDDFYDEFINDRKIKELYRSNEKFDLIFTEHTTVQEYALLLSRKFDAPVIGLQPYPTHNVLNAIMGNSLSLSYIPDMCTAFSKKMTFVERAMNVFASVRGLYYHYNYYIPKVERLMRQQFPGAPSIQELSRNVSLMFVNDHLTADFAHPRTPNIIPVAGIHVAPPKPLPQSIQRFMDEAADGVVYFSLGTYVLDDLQPQEYYDMYCNVFKKLKQRVIWKTRKENIEGLPPNVMTVKWAPQNDILGHPKCVLFITHGGQLSRVEAFHFGVPVVSIPQFYDQHSNSESYVHKGVGVRISRTDVTEKTVSDAIHKVLYDKSYRENMKRLSAIFRDRPMSPAESVVFWTEYVLRHGGAAHLRPASTELRWYQLILLDIVLALIVVAFAFAALVVILFILVRKCLSKVNQNKTLPFQKKIN